MKSLITLILSSSIIITSCGKSDELESCESNLQKKIEEIGRLQYQISDLQSKNQTLIDSFNKLKNNNENSEYETSRMISSSQLQISGIIRDIEWNRYSNVQDIISDLKTIEIMVK